MISISTQTFDTSGNVVIIPDLGKSKLFNKPIRVQRTKTLDGEVYINHSGYSPGDRTLSVIAKISREDGDNINRIATSYSSVFISFSDGLYIGTISNIKIGNGSLKLTILLKQEEN